MKPCALCIVHKCSHHLAPCHTLLLWWAAHLQLAPALLLFPRHDLSQLPLTSFLVRLNPAQIHNMWVLAIWPNPQPLQVMSPSILPNIRILQNTRIYVSNLYFPQTEFCFDLRFCWKHCDAPPESDLDDEQIRALLASPLYMQEREANADRSQLYHSVREKNLMSGSSQVPKSMERPVALFSTKNRSNQETYFDRRFSSGHQQVLGNSEPLFRFSHPDNSANSLLEGNRDHMLAEAKSEILEQECKVDSLNTSIRELQAHSHR